MEDELRTIRRYYHVEKTSIGFLRFIFEAYDGIAVITTIDAGAGHIVFTIPPGCLGEVEAVITILAKDMTITPMDTDVSDMAEIY